MKPSTTALIAGLALSAVATPLAAQERVEVHRTETTRTSSTTTNGGWHHNWRRHKVCRTHWYNHRKVTRCHWTRGR